MRGKQAPKRKIKADAKYGSVVIAKFINYVMKRGQKSTARKIVYGCFDILQEKVDKKEFGADIKDVLTVFEQAMKNVSPQLEIRGRRVGGANYQIPYPVRGERKIALTFRWLLAAADARKGKPMAEKLAIELADAFNNTGSAVKKKNDVHRMAEANRAFAHFAL
jgi:small subunit ribosomal protein S7